MPPSTGVADAAEASRDPSIITPGAELKSPFGVRRRGPLLPISEGHSPIIFCGLGSEPSVGAWVIMSVGVIAPAQRAAGTSIARANTSVGRRNLMRRSQAPRAAEMLFHAQAVSKVGGVFLSRSLVA